MMPDAPWDEIAHAASRMVAASSVAASSREDKMQSLVDLLWNALHWRGVSWLGFYEADPSGEPQMILRARRDKPACSPIGLHGACGQCLLGRRALVVRDVRELGEGYIACDPLDRSELVVPCLNRDGTAWGVLDADSHLLGAFSDADAVGLQRVLEASGLSVPRLARSCD
jgi:putative methionine-R-sulfoxide reductase with GAF domain